MATLFVFGVFMFLILRAWSQKKSRFPELAQRYLCLMPFVPLISLINHNIDHERFGMSFRLAPFFLMSVLLAYSFGMHRSISASYRGGKEFLFLACYAVLSLFSAFFATDITWALISWGWTVPGCLVFLVAGQMSRIDDLARNREMVYTVLAFLSINLALVAYGLLTGRASDVFHTRNFGSAFASNSVLLFLTVYSGFGWVHARKSFVWMFLFIGFSAFSMLISISRTSVGVALIYASFMVTLRFHEFRRLAVSIAVATCFLWIALIAFEKVSGLQFTDQLVVNWQNRLGSGSLQRTFEAAMSHRAHIFDEEWRHVADQGPFVGEGFGNFQATTSGGFRDGHNLLLTESYENGWMATGFLYAFLIAGIGHAIRKLSSGSRDEWPIPFCLLGFMFIAHTTGAVMSSRGFDSYYTPVSGWGICFLIGLLSSNRKAAIHQLSSHRIPSPRIVKAA